MNIEPMSRRPYSRETFERNLFLLADALHGGRLVMRRGISTDGLARVRKLPNGRIDLAVVDESTRLTANTHADMAERFFGRIEATGGTTREARHIQAMPPSDTPSANKGSRRKSESSRAKKEKRKLAKESRKKNRR